MFRTDVTYTNFEGVPEVETLYFNLTKMELLDHMDLQGRFEDLQARFSGPQRQLTPTEVRLYLDLVKDMAELSYGVRSEDGKRFSKSAALWEEFTQTAIYDAWLFGLFQDPEKATEFLINVFPADLREQVAAEESNSIEVRRLLAQQLPAPVQATSTTPPPPVAPQTVEARTDDRPAWMREDREPTPAEFKNMTKQQLVDLMLRKSQQ